MSIEDILRRAKAQEADNITAKQEQENQKLERTIEDEVKGIYANREDQIAEYESRLQTLAQRQERLAQAEQQRNADLAEIDRLEAELGIHNVNEEKANEAGKQIAVLDLEQSQIDEYLLEIQQEKATIASEQRRLTGELEKLKEDTEKRQKEVEEFSGEFNPADIATKQPTISPEAMAKIQEEAMAENVQRDQEVAAQREREFNEKYQKQLDQDSAEIVSAMQRIGGSDSVRSTSIDSSIMLSRDKLNDGYLEALTKRVKDLIDSCYRGDGYAEFMWGAKKDAAGQYSQNIRESLQKSQQNMREGERKIARVTVNSIEGRKTIWQKG